jgi:hypothetical protein
MTSCAKQQHLEICRAFSWQPIFRVETGDIVYKQITAVSQTAPIQLTATAHGMPDDWLFAVTGCTGPDRLNAENDPPKLPDSDRRLNDYFRGTVTDADTIEINAVNGTGLDPYTGGGYLQYFKPLDFAIVDHAEFIVWESVIEEGDPLLSLSSATGGVNMLSGSKVQPVLSQADADALTWNSGVYALRFVMLDGTTIAGLEGRITAP